MGTRSIVTIHPTAGHKAWKGLEHEMKHPGAISGLGKEKSAQEGTHRHKGFFLPNPNSALDPVQPQLGSKEQTQ